MMRDEVETALSKVSHRPEIVWIDRNKHEVPKKLTAYLQEAIDKHQDKDQILLCFGLCGRGVCGITSKHATVIIPRFHDCIGILRSCYQGVVNEVSPTSYYLTGGWMDFFDEVEEKYIKKYGEERYRKLHKTFYGNYESMTLLATGGFSLEEVRPRCMAAAERIGLRFEEEEGSTRVLEKLFSGSWDEEFLVLKPGQGVNLKDFI
jgi:hypothetical protein